MGVGNGVLSFSAIHVDADPERVFAVLSDPQSFGDWVVGSDTIRDADADWPATGSRFHHTVGGGPLKVRDHTEVLDSRPPHRLVLRARARPLGTALVTLTIVEEREGAEIIMREQPADPLSRLLFNPVVQPLLHFRNLESLRRLKRLVEQTA